MAPGDTVLYLGPNQHDKSGITLKKNSMPTVITSAMGAVKVSWMGHSFIVPASDLAANSTPVMW